MKKLIFSMLLLPVFAYAQQSGDLKAEINQTTFSKIIGSIKYPFTMVEHREDFPGLLPASLGNSEIVSDQDEDKNYSLDEIKALFRWAIEGESNSVFGNTEQSESLKSALQESWFGLLNEMEEISKDTVFLGRKGEFTPAELNRWKTLKVNPLIDELQSHEKKLGRKGFEVKLHLAYYRVDLLQAPTLTVNSPSFEIAEVSVRPTATGELWTKMPHFSCCPPRISWHWDRTLAVSASLKIAASATVTFGIAGLKVLGTGQFTKLVLDYPILRELNLAGIVNRGLLNKRFELYDASKFLASIPYIDRNFTISKISLPPTRGAVVVEINISEVH